MQGLAYDCVDLHALARLRAEGCHSGLHFAGCLSAQHSHLSLPDSNKKRVDTAWHPPFLIELALNA
jgi:hypothetical protein